MRGDNGGESMTIKEAAQQVGIKYARASAIHCQNKINTDVQTNQEGHDLQPTDHHEQEEEEFPQMMEMPCPKQKAGSIMEQFDRESIALLANLADQIKNRRHSR